MDGSASTLAQVAVKDNKLTETGEFVTLTDRNGSPCTLKIFTTRKGERVLSAQDLWKATELSIFDPGMGHVAVAVNDGKAVVINGDTAKRIEFTIIPPTSGVGQSVIDGRKFSDDTGLYLYDPGLRSVASKKSDICTLDGENGILRYRGIDIAHLAENYDYDQIVHLLLYGDLPDANQNLALIEDLQSRMTLPPQVAAGIEALFPNRTTAMPMSILASIVAALPNYYSDTTEVTDQVQLDAAIHNLVAKIPVLGAMIHRYTMHGDMSIKEPDSKLGVAGNFLHMAGLLTGNTNVDAVLIKAINVIGVTHAEHELNASTFAVNHGVSSRPNAYAAIVSGIEALSGKLHGGANEEAVKQLEMLEANGGEAAVANYIDRVKRKEAKLMGFGHAVYTKYDPRAKIMQAMTHQVLKALGKENDPLFKIALKLEQAALNDNWFKDRNLYPNVDFYSGLMMKAMGIEPKMFTVLFAMYRTSGWSAHLKETVLDPHQRIGRPRVLDTTPDDVNSTPPVTDISRRIRVPSGPAIGSAG